MVHIVERTVSEAWLGAMDAALKAPGRQVVPLIVEIEGLRGREGIDDQGLRADVDELLSKKGLASTTTVAETIFPYSIWKKRLAPTDLFERYLKVLPKLRRYGKNRRGIYFERLINYPGKKGEVGTNQLEHIIETFRRGNHRRSALQASIFVPESDHSHARQLGFPCLQHVWFSYRIGEKALTVTGAYANQYLMERAYGNYVGLLRLGEFIAHYLDFELDRVVCIAAIGHLEKNVPDVRALVKKWAHDQ